MDTFVLIGGGMAGAKAAETLRAEGFAGRVVLVAGEPEIPYERPPLSKGYLLGKEERESARVHPPDWYGEHDVQLRLGAAVTALHGQLRDDPRTRQEFLALTRGDRS